MTDKTVTIKNATNKELDELLIRLRKERELQNVIGELKRNSTSPNSYSYEQAAISTEEPIESLYHEGINDVLAHYGILGMKWGVRRYQNKDGSHTKAGQVRYASPNQRGQKTLEKRIAKNEARELIRKDKTFSKPENVRGMAENASQTMGQNKAYLAESKSIFNKLSKAGLTGRTLNNAYQEKMLDVVDKYMKNDKTTYSPSGDMRISMALIEFNGDKYLTPVLVDNKEIRHAEDEHIYGLYSVNKNGKLILVDDETFAHENKDLFLTHYGILGMKWGVRRERGPDGRVKTKSVSADFKESRELKAKGYKNLSNAELKALTQRLENERKLRDLSMSDQQKGLDFVRTATAAGTTIAGLYALSTTPLGKAVEGAVKKALSNQTRLKGV